MMQLKYQLDRRGFLRVGAAGVTASALPLARVQADTVGSSSGPAESLGTGRAKSVVLVLLSGGLSQLDSLDPKPEAPAEVRGEFNTIGTKTAGVHICEHLPRLASQSDRWSIVRTLSHREHNHLLATHVALTGRPTPLPRGGSDLDRVESRSDFPNFASALAYIRPRQDGIPSGVSLPNYLIEGPLTWPGQHAGFLGAKYDPWQIQGDPNDKNFQMQALAMRDGISADRMQSRGALLDVLNRERLKIGGNETSAFQEQQQIAFNLLTSNKMSAAFDIHREPDDVRERYGRNKFGQSLLMARRMVDVGVPIIEATMGIVQTWDTHVDNWGRLKNTLLPQLDQGLAALMDDLAASGKLSETLVIVMGEFGRTPKVSTLPGEKIPGRDHWAHTYSGLFAGAGVRGGQVIGQTDSMAAYPVSRSWTPADICTTVFNALGVDKEITITDPLQRPHYLLNCTVMSPLYTGREA
ncbi:MAG: DUF1501 domain-containing protein [Pirellulales bacterium]